MRSCDLIPAERAGRPALLAAILAAAALAPAPAAGAALSVTAFDAKGRVLDSAGLLRYISPVSRAKKGVSPEESGLFVKDGDGRPAAGRPWWDARSAEIIWRWDGASKVIITLPWPILKDGFSTVTLDNGGKGFIDGQTILLNEEIAATAYRKMQASLKRRRAGKPAYQPAPGVLKLVEEAKRAMAKATASRARRKKAKLFNKALSQISFAWQQILFDHGKQNAQDPKLGARLRFGLSIDETILERIHDFKRIADQLVGSGAGWVRLVFADIPGDFTFSQGSSFTVYDRFVDLLVERNIRIMGSVLDSLLWPDNLNPRSYGKRTRNLARHFKGRIRTWEIASEPNANWLGGATTPLSDETILLAVQKAVVAVKSVDRSLETAATLHWWEGTAGDNRHALFPWLDWAVPRGFGRGIDVLSLSIYPHRHPMGIAFEPTFQELNRRFPDKGLMLGGFNFADGRKLRGYWWLAPKNVKDARKDLLVLYMGISASIPNSLGGGFYWPTLKLMLPPGKKPTELFRLHKRSLDSLRR